MDPCECVKSEYLWYFTVTVDATLLQFATVAKVRLLISFFRWNLQLRRILRQR